MRSATRQEIEYLSSFDADAPGKALVREMTLQLAALRNFDQAFNESDWHPQRTAKKSASVGHLE
jgi:hypothetical protein